MFNSEREMREYIGHVLDLKITQIVEHRLDEWYKQKIEAQVDEAIKRAFSKMVVIKFGE